MRNVKNHQLAKVIVKTFDEYVDDIYAAYGNVAVAVNLDGTVYDERPPYEILASYYGIRKITNIHSDGSEYNNIWIAYED